MKIEGSADCGNSPKNKFVQDCVVQLESARSLTKAFSDEFVWVRQNGVLLESRQAADSILRKMHKPIKVVVEHAIAHGKVGAGNGTATFADGSHRRFCHVLEFATAKAECVTAVSSFSC
jgi:hypothetical protein